ncbi:SPOSA6832_05127, partial [Sporobolomyces salmonicolor]
MAVSIRRVLVAEEEGTEERSEQEMAVEAVHALNDPEDTVPDEYRLAGTTSTPRLRRALFFPTSSPSAPAIDRTLTDAPLPSVPLSVLRDPVIAGTIAVAPHLFDVSTPIRVNVLERWLAPHPNRDLVDSILNGLRHGFWPGFEGELDHSSSGPPAPNLDEDDLDFITMQLSKDFEDGYLSEPFDSLLPGMVVSPTFVVRIDGRKPRAVVDQSASGLNDGVSKEAARIRYDTIAELARLMRHRRLRGDSSSPGVVWKSDVSGAFRTLPVAPQWQVRQVHRSRLVDSRGQHRWIYYIDRRVVFGGRYSPRLWCIVLNAILWGVRHRLGLEFPLVYVDDTFGYDISGKTSIIKHPANGESREVPLQQAAVLVAWKLLGVPWEWKKQENGKALVVLGHYIDASSFNISLPSKAKDDFVALVRSFISSRDRPLVEWWRLTGYAQWAASTSPFIKFALASSYAKTAGKTRRLAPVKLNNAVRRDLAWLADELESAPPLDILDPALEDWGKSDASLVLYSDACLRAEGSVASGLGYWFKVAGEQHRRAFAARIVPPLEDIFLAEAFAAHAAILRALDSNVAGHRLLLFTDNASTVYAFDSGSARPDVAILVREAYERLRAAQVDFRIRHIPGYLNTTADASQLVQERPHHLRRSNLLHIAIAGGGSKMTKKRSRGRQCVTFVTQPQFPSSRLGPHPSLKDLDRQAKALIRSSKEPSTRRGYQQQLNRHWFPFLRIYHLPQYPTVKTLIRFVAWAGDRVRGVDKILSAIRWHYDFSDRQWAKLRSDPGVRNVLLGHKKRTARPMKRSPPLLPPHLAAFVRHALQPGATYDDLLAATLAMVGFGGVLRLGELTLPPHKKDRDPRRLVRRDTVEVTDDAFSFFCPKMKQDRVWKGAFITIARANSTPEFNFITLFRLYLVRRDARLPNFPFLFATSSGKVPLPSFLTSRLPRFAPGVTGHGLRAGGATYLASRGVRPDVIQRLGRWTSETWTIYIRDNPALAAAIQRIDLN